MLKSGYFTNRSEIIQWINSTLDLQMTKIEQLGTGSIYCHLLDAAYPSKVPLHRVKWGAYLEIEFIYNFKILQNCFQHLGINKNIQVQKLVKAKYQDNLELIQWMKYHFSEQIKNNRGYDPQQRRGNAVVYLPFSEKLEKTRSTANLLNCTNKENANQQNYAESPRGSLKSQRNTLGSSSHRQLLPEEPQRKRTPSFLQVVSKCESTSERPRLTRSNNRVRTESGPLILCERLYPYLILEADQEQCF